MEIYLHSESKNNDSVKRVKKFVKCAIHFISAYANLPNSSCHSWKHKSVFLQVLHQSSVPSRITPLYFFSSNVYFGQSSQLKSNFFRFSSAWVKLPQIVNMPHMSILKWQTNSSTNFVLLFIVMTHNSSVNFNVIHSRLWIKRSHQSPNFETFKCSGENTSNFWSHFLNHKFVFFSNFASLFSVLKDNPSVLF